jgi:hypothetical protein
MQAWKYSFCTNDEYYIMMDIYNKDNVKVIAK